MRRIVFLGFSAVLLLGMCGCASSPASNDDMACQSYGAAPGTDAYFQCRMMKDQQRQQTNAAIVGAYLMRH